jgi:outer membrane beta-barrel protein
MTRPELPLRSRVAVARLALGGLAGLLLALAPAPARAQSKSDAFAGKIPPVSADLYSKAGRFEGTISGNLSLNDAFYRKYFGGLKLGYHFTESLSAHALVSTGVDVKAGSAQVCPSNGGCHPASQTQMYQVPGNIRMIVGLEGAWAPVYGKLNVFSERVVHFDLSIIAGADWISYRKVISSADADLLAVNGGTPSYLSTVGGHLGLGVRIFLTDWMAARLEIRDYLYRVSVPNWQVNGGAKQDLQNQLFTELGVSFFFPSQNRPVP